MEKPDAQIKIDKDVPYPKRVSPMDKYPFAKMKVNDSFFTAEPRNRVAGAASRYGRRHNMRFSLRTEGTGCRVWRIE